MVLGGLVKFGALCSFICLFWTGSHDAVATVLELTRQIKLSSSSENYQALPSKAGIKVLHHTQLLLQFLITGAPTGVHQVGSYNIVIHRRASKGPIYH